MAPVIVDQTESEETRRLRLAERIEAIARSLGRSCKVSDALSPFADNLRTLSTSCHFVLFCATKYACWWFGRSRLSLDGHLRSCEAPPSSVTHLVTLFGEDIHHRSADSTAKCPQGNLSSSWGVSEAVIGRLAHPFLSRPRHVGIYSPSWRLPETQGRRRGRRYQEEVRPIRIL